MQSLIGNNKFRMEYSNIAERYSKKAEQQQNTLNV